MLLAIMLKIVKEGSSLTIVNEGLSLKIVNETTNFINRSFLEELSLLEKLSFLKKKLHATLLNVVLHEVKQLWGS